MNILNKASKMIDKVGHNLAHKKGQDGWGQIIGGVDGQPFEFGGQQYSLVGVRGRYGAFINGLQFRFLDMSTGQFHQTPELGGDGGKHFQFGCNQGEHIVRIQIWASKYIERIQFATNTGRRTQIFGGKDEKIGKSKVVDARNKRICGVKGRNSQMIDQLCFGVASTDKPIRKRSSSSSSLSSSEKEANLKERKEENVQKGKHIGFSDKQQNHVYQQQGNMMNKPPLGTDHKVNPTMNY